MTAFRTRPSFSVDQDALGRIWFGTASGGANVYDGHRIRVFVNEPDPQTSVSQRHRTGPRPTLAARSMSETWGAGLNRLESAEGTFERLNPSSAPSHIQTLFEDSSGRIWVGSSGDGLMVFDGQSTFTEIPLRNGQRLARIWSLAEGHGGRIWVAADAGLYELDDQLRLEAIDLELGEQPRALATTEGRLWIGTNSGLPLPQSGHRSHPADLRRPAHRQRTAQRSPTVASSSAPWPGSMPSTPPPTTSSRRSATAACASFPTATFATSTSTVRA